MLDNPKALDLAKKIDQRASIIAATVKREIAMACAGKPEFEAIVLEAVERKLMAMRHEAQLQAAGMRT